MFVDTGTRLIGNESYFVGEEPTIPKSNVDNKYDEGWISIHTRMKHHEVGVGQKLHKDFYAFLDANPIMYARYMTLVQNPHQFSVSEVDNIIKEFVKYRTLYTFKQLYEIDTEWYLFFKENTDQYGNAHPEENRVGVHKTYVNDIMKIKHLTGRDILNATNVYTTILHRVSCLELV